MRRRHPVTPPEGWGKGDPKRSRGAGVANLTEGARCDRAGEVSRGGAVKGCCHWTLPISSYVVVSAGPSQSPHASACPEHLSLGAQPCRRAPLCNSDRNRKSRRSGSGEVVCPTVDEKGKELRLTLLGLRPPIRSECKPRPARDLLLFLVTQLCPTLCDPLNCRHLVPPLHGK